MPGVQDDWLAILRFDTEANLQAWLDSPERQKLLREAEAFTEEFHARIVRTGFDQWFPVPAAGASPPAVWKQNMLVLLMLYPVVFLFGLSVQTPLLIGRAGLPFAVALFIGNVASVAAAQLAGAVDQQPLRLVAAAGGPALRGGSRSAAPRWWSRSTPLMVLVFWRLL